MNIRRQSGNFQFEEDPFSNSVQGFGKNFHEVLLWLKFLQTKLKVKSMNTNYYDLYYTVLKNRDDKEIVIDKYEQDYIKFNDYKTSNIYIGQKR